MPRARSIQLRTPEIALRIVEVGRGEPTLFLHGFSLCAAHWAPLIAQLPSRHSIAIDMPGHGGSDAADFTGVDLRGWYRDLLTGCLDALGLESVHLVGHSQGAMIGMWFALDVPERVRSLIAIGTPAVALGNRLDGLRLLARPVIGRLLLSMPKPARMYRGILAGTIGRRAMEAASKDLIQVTYLSTQRFGFGSTVSTYLGEMFDGMDAKPQRYVLGADELARMQPPVLIVWGRDDEGIPTIAEVRQHSALIPKGQFVVVPGGHEPWLDDLDSTGLQVKTFLDRELDFPDDDGPADVRMASRAPDTSSTGRF
jgi:pimeloyl-ACP methyl ester carboxylesterase